MNYFVLPETDRSVMIANIASFLFRCLPGKRVRVTIEFYRRKRSLEQNAYLWGVCYPTILREGGEELGGWTADDLHQLFLKRHFGTATLEWNGAIVSRPQRTSSKLSTIEFMEFVASIQQFAAEQGIYIEDPNEVVR